MRILINGLRALVDLYLAGVTAWAVAWTRRRDQKGVLGLFNAWAFWLLAPALAVGAMGLGRRRRRWPTLAWLVGGGGLLLSRYRWPLAGLARLTRRAARAEDPPDATLRIFSFNILKENKGAATVLAAIRREAPDVILIQELEPGMSRWLQDGLPDYTFCRPNRGFGFFSRYPLTITGTWDRPGSRPFASRITVLAPAGAVDLYNVHLQAISPNAVRKTGLSTNFRVREEQMALLAEAMAGRPGIPALALGDYNMTEGNETYRVATASLTDAWLAAGRGPGWTWPRADYPPGRPVLRLDYCFCTAEVRPANMRVIYEPLGSDHCPIVVDAAYRDGARP